MHKLVLLTYLWLQDVPTKIIKTMLILFSRTLADWGSFLSEICTTLLWNLQEDEFKIGGLGVIVAIDETII